LNKVLGRPFALYLPFVVAALVTLVVGGAAYWLALAPVHTVKTDLRTYGGGKLEQDGAISYIWTRPDTRFVYRDLPRFAPIFLTLSVILERPPEAAPTRLELIEMRGTGRNGDIDERPIPIQTVEYAPGKNGVQNFVVRIPAVQDRSADNFVLLLKTNGFRVAGDPRELGVRVVEANLSVSKSGLLLAIFQRPIFPALLILLASLGIWGAALGLRLYESASLVAPIGFTAGALTNDLIYESWGLLLGSLVTLGSSLAWLKYGRKWLENGSGWKAFGLISVGIAGFSVFSLFATGYAGDLFYFREMIAPLLQYGPFGTYPKAPRLDYPPGAVFQLYFYGVLSQPFGVTYNENALRGLMTLAMPLVYATFWYGGLWSKVERTALARTYALLGFCLPVLFVTVGWIQTDGWLLWLMTFALLLVVWGRPASSATVQAFAVLYKGQSWLLLPFYGLAFLQKFGWKTAFLMGGLCLALIALIGGAGFGFSTVAFDAFIAQPMVGGESDWGGINTFNLMHLLGYDKVVVEQPWLLLSYIICGVAYLSVLVVCWRRFPVKLRATSYEQQAKPENNGQSSIAEKSSIANRQSPIEYEWLLGAAFLMTFFFFFWVKMHERYLYFGLGLLIFAALYSRKLYLPLLLLNLHFTLNVLFGYLPPRRDPIPNNFFFWRHLLKNDVFQNVLCVFGIAVCLWIGWLYFTKPGLEDKGRGLEDEQRKFEPESMVV
jgi:hypothetical protein